MAHVRIIGHSQSRLYMPAFLLLMIFSSISVALWRIHAVSFISVNAAVGILEVGDVAITRPAAVGELQAGDTVAYYDPRDTTRIQVALIHTIQPTEQLFVPQSASSHDTSSPLSTSLLVGKVKYRLAHAGYILDLTRSRAGLMAGLYIPAIIILADELRLLSASYNRRIYRLYPAYSARF